MGASLSVINIQKQKNFMRKYILLFSVVQSQPTHTHVSRDQATGLSSKSHYQVYDRNYENQTP